MSFVIELVGVLGCGKSTVLKKLRERCVDLDVEFREPDMAVVEELLDKQEELDDYFESYRRPKNLHRFEVKEGSGYDSGIYLGKYRKIETVCCIVWLKVSEKEMIESIRKRGRKIEVERLDDGKGFYNQVFRNYEVVMDLVRCKANEDGCLFLTVNRRNAVSTILNVIYANNIERVQFPPISKKEKKQMLVAVTGLYPYKKRSCNV